MTPAEEYIAVYRGTVEYRGTVSDKMQDIWDKATPDERQAIDRAYALEIMNERSAEEDFQNGD